MFLNVKFQLPTLHCVQQYDESGLSEPYLWLAWFWGDLQTFQTPGTRVRVRVPFSTGRRADYPDTVANGQDVPVPAWQNSFSVDVDTGPDGKAVLVGLMVALLEEDETPDSAILAGRNTFETALSDQLNAYVDSHLLSLINGQLPSPDDIKQIQDAVTGAVKDAIESKLSWADKLFRDQDDFLGFSYTYLAGAHVASGFSAELQLPAITRDEYRWVWVPGGTSIGFHQEYKKVGHQHYELRNLRVDVSPSPDACATEVENIKATLASLGEVRQTIACLKQELVRASADEKPALRARLREVRERSLAEVVTRLNTGLKGLEVCRVATH